VKLLSEQYPADIKETVKELSDDEKKTLIKDLITQKKLDGLKALLDSGVDVNMIISSTDSLLMTACRFSNSDMVKLLLTYNPDIDYQDQYGNTALTLAIYNMWHHKEMIPLLLEAGADPNTKIGAGRTAQKNSTVLSKMISLTLNNKSEEEYQIVEMFLSRGADPNISLPLMAAAYKGDVRLVKLLLEYGVDPNLKDNQGRTALDMAIKKQQQEVIDLLQK